MENDLQLFLYRCPDEQAYALSEVLCDWELSYDWDGEFAELGEVSLGMEPYTYREAVCLDVVKQLADEIIKAAPGAWFQAWTDPSEGALGTLVQYTPELGKFEAYCDADGQPHFTAHEVLQAAKLGEVGAKVLTGYAWSQVLNGSATERVIKVEVPET